MGNFQDNIQIIMHKNSFLKKFFLDFKYSFLKKILFLKQIFLDFKYNW